MIRIYRLDPRFKSLGFHRRPSGHWQFGLWWWVLTREPK